MKKILFLLFAVLTFSSAHSQIIITGIQSNPYGTDDNYEYIQLQATENINFATTNYSVVTCLITSTGSTEGWATGGLVTYKFNLITGSVSKGDFFYVGGTKKLVSGIYSGNNTPSMASSKWIRNIDYTTTAGDGFGSANADQYGILANGNSQTLGPSGVAVFSGTTVSKTTVPMDVVFFGGAPIAVTTFTITNNDHYNTLNGTTPQLYFGAGTNTYSIDYRQVSNANNTNGAFLKLSGNYNPTTSTWDLSRTFEWKATGANGGVSTIEGSSLVTLPVKLTTFTAKPVNNKVQLNWATASETRDFAFKK